MMINKSIEERIANMEEMAISNQVFNDQNWNILKKFRKPLENKVGKYQYFLLIECKKCGNLQLIGTSSIKRNIPCSKCVLKKCEGEIHGTYKILKYDHTEEFFSEQRVIKKHYYLIQCINCGKTYIKQKNVAQWSKYNQCSKCNIVDSDHPELGAYYSDYKSSAKIRGIDWQLSYEEFLTLVLNKCAYCGEMPSQRTINGRFNIIVNGIDRIDSNRGYTIDNCTSCCTKCNYMKNTLSVNDFFDHINKIYKYSLNKGSTTIENTTNEVGSEQSTLK